MAFTLRITFSGLCLFVPEPANGGGTGRMHVLMPSMSGEHDAADRHVAALAYDTGYLVQGGAPTGITALVSLSGQEFTPVVGAAANLSLCGHIVDLREITQRGVDPDHLGADSQNKLMARATLGAGRITRVAPGVCWEWRPGEIRRIAHKVQWEIPDVDGDSLTLVSEAIGGGGGQKALGTLFPMNDRVNLVLYHETSQDLPPDPLPVESQRVPARGFIPHHFAAYYSLFGDSVTTLMPRFWSDDCSPPANPCVAMDPDLGGMPYMCLVAGVGDGGG